MFRTAIICSSLLCVIICCSSPKKDDATRNDGYDDYEPAQPQKKLKGSKTYTIEIKQMKFIPDRLVVHKGDKIVWINKDIVDHDVTEKSTKAWASSKLTPNASWSMVASKNELYYCSIHVVMQGKIVVDVQSAADGNEVLLTGETSGITMCR